MEIPNTTSFLCIENNQQKRINNDVFHNEDPALSSYRFRTSVQSSMQAEIPVIDLTVDTPFQNELPSVETQQNSSLLHGRPIDVIDVDSLPDRRCSQRHLEYFQSLSFESFIDLGDMLVLGHSLSQGQANNSINTAFYPRRITRQATNQIYQWDDQILQTNDNFLHALINRITSSNRRRINSSVRRSTSYPYYIRSHQDFISSSLEYNQFLETDNEVVSRKNTSLSSIQYKKPPKAMKGFTRSLNRNQKLVCPNCIHELGISDDPVKKNIWVGKCGHVYCGVCALVFRSMKSKGPHSAICVVKHCHKIISGNHNLREIYV
ncbi:hypothetical protein PMAC_000736 [Pneumocystis sp. 'macacae']|nr:hypothetical protein PMAC_000736 [Pneumocystis sp. 'macacae']